MNRKFPTKLGPAFAASVILSAFSATGLFAQTQEVGEGPRDRTEDRRLALRIWLSMQRPIDMMDFAGTMTLKEALGLLYEKLSARGVELPILVDVRAFQDESVEGKRGSDPYDTEVSYRGVPRYVSAGLFLRITLSQIPTGNATYLIRRNYVEITTRKAANGRFLVPSITD